MCSRLRLHKIKSATKSARNDSPHDQREGKYRYCLVMMLFGGEDMKVRYKTCQSVHPL